ncbi:MAG: hypothetical protein A3F14_06390 [Gammaproteobacteria bacterium RIFCSPHIGHO2_12_FULL_43_28]|nr:MAG: hypothetical protein A3F14_06390 [Gammaproteobacteria bacterium RIFCSPHIGHO2_12_FULL_43_28]
MIGKGIQSVKVLLLGLLLLSCIFAISQFKVSRIFPIHSVRVYGAPHLDPLYTQQLLMPLVVRGFFGIQVETIREHLLQMPWVDEIYVRRIWPDQVVITVLERKPIASWNDQSLLGDDGELFSPKRDTYPDALPKLVGPEGKQIQMLEYFRDMNRLLESLHAKIAYLELTPYSTWDVVLSNGITLHLGNKDILTRLHHFVKVYPKILANREDDVEYVDLRYPNGLAVQWKGVKKV